VRYEAQQGALMMMNVTQIVLDLLNARKSKILLIAEAALPQSQYQAFRKLFLNEFGHSGLEGELVKVIAEFHVMEKHGRE